MPESVPTPATEKSFEDPEPILQTSPPVSRVPFPAKELPPEPHEPEAAEEVEIEPRPFRSRPSQGRGFNQPAATGLQEEESFEEEQALPTRSPLVALLWLPLLALLAAGLWFGKKHFFGPLPAMWTPEATASADTSAETPADLPAPEAEPAKDPLDFPGPPSTSEEIRPKPKPPSEPAPAAPDNELGNSSEDSPQPAEDNGPSPAPDVDPALPAPEPDLPENTLPPGAQEAPSSQEETPEPRSEPEAGEAAPPSTNPDEAVPSPPDGSPLDIPEAAPMIS